MPDARPPAQPRSPAAHAVAPDARRAPTRAGRPTRAWLTVLIALTACGADEGSWTPGKALGPLPGTWAGVEVEFVLSEGAISQLKVQEQPCSDGACQQVCDDSACQGVFHGDLPGTFSLDAGLKIQTAELELEGTFSDERHVAGTLALLGQGGCCKRIGAWTAEWIHGLDGGSVGPTGPGKPGSLDWNGASSGSMHPGPSLSGWQAQIPEALSAAQKQALSELNDLRAQLGAGPVLGDIAIAQAAQAHAAFYVQHIASYQSSGLSPHAEDASFGDGFTGANHGQRMKAAGFDGQPGAEVMAFSGSVSGAIAGWLATLYHRIPLISPRSSHMGFGIAANGKARTEVMDFAVRGALADDPIVVYPWPGQSGLPRSWNGGESPQPPKPPKGYPSGPMITATLPWAAAFGAGHKLLDPKGTEVPHMWVTAENDATMKSMAGSSAAMYAHGPLQAETTYTVVMPLTRNNEPHELRWRFTTGAK